MHLPEVTYRDAREDDALAIAAINAGSEAVTSPMDAGRFCCLLPDAAIARVALVDNEPAGFVLGFVEGAQYDGENFRWFAARLRRFLYIDRIVIAESCRRLGIGHGLYESAVRDAKRCGLLWLAAEIDVDPPNPVSLRFHQRQGFREIDVYRVSAGKRVSMQVLSLAEGG